MGESKKYDKPNDEFAFVKNSLFLNKDKTPDAGLDAKLIDEYVTNLNNPEKAGASYAFLDQVLNMADAAFDNRIFPEKFTNDPLIKKVFYAVVKYESEHPEVV